MAEFSRSSLCAVVLVILAAAGAACGTALPASPPPPTTRTASSTRTLPESFALASNAFPAGGLIPKRFSCDGDNLSPELKWDKPPEGTLSFALVVDDPDAPGGTFTHWILFDLPPSLHEIPEGATGLGKGGLNGRGQSTYTGPCPPFGTHRYFFTLYALDVPALGLREGASVGEVDKAIASHLLAKTLLMGKYSR